MCAQALVGVTGEQRHGVGGNGASVSELYLADSGGAGASLSLISFSQSPNHHPPPTPTPHQAEQAGPVVTWKELEFAASLLVLTR